MESGSTARVKFQVIKKFPSGFELEPLSFTAMCYIFTPIFRFIKTSIGDDRWFLDNMFGQRQVV